jgi:hypothetical protein
MENSRYLQTLRLKGLNGIKLLKDIHAEFFRGMSAVGYGDDVLDDAITPAQHTAGFLGQVRLHPSQDRIFLIDCQ